jgi:hypothetical protein
MAAVASNKLASPIPVALTKTTLTASDTMTYNAAANGVLFLDNPTASPVTVTIDGDKAATAFAPGGIGSTIDLSAGLPIIVPANKTIAVRLADIQRYLVGAIAVKGGVGVIAWLIEV